MPGDRNDCDGLQVVNGFHNNVVHPAVLPDAAVTVSVGSHGRESREEVISEEVSDNSVLLITHHGGSPEVGIVNSIIGVKPARSWFLPAWVHSVPIDFLIDPGAVVSAISYECWRVSLEPCKLQLSAANSEALKIEGQCQIAISLHGLTVNVMVLVCALNFPALLGTDLLGSVFPHILDLKNGTMVNDQGVILQLHRANLSTHNVVRTTSSVVVPARSEAVIQGPLRTTRGDVVCR